MKLNIWFFSRTTPISSSQQAHVVIGYQVGQHEYRTFPSSLRVLWTAPEVFNVGWQSANSLSANRRGWRGRSGPNHEESQNNRELWRVLSQEWHEHVWVLERSSCCRVETIRQGGKSSTEIVWEIRTVKLVQRLLEMETWEQVEKYGGDGTREPISGVMRGKNQQFLGL